MPQRNGYKGNGGRSAIARKVKFGGASPTNGIMPSVFVLTNKGAIIRTSYFGGNIKGGAPPSATGFNRLGNTNQTVGSALNKNYLFNFRRVSSVKLKWPSNAPL